MKFLVDTDTCSAYIKGNKKVFQRFQQYRGRLYISTVTLAELQTWVQRSGSSKIAHEVSELLDETGLIPFDEGAARMFGATLSNGTDAPVADLQIASTALDRGFALVTHNTKDFKNIPNLDLEDWMK